MNSNVFELKDEIAGEKYLDNEIYEFWAHE